MEAGLRRRRAGVLAVVCFALLACDQDPARSVKIIARPIPKSESAAPPPGAAAAPPAAEPARSANTAPGSGPTSKPRGTAKPDATSSPGATPAVAAAASPAPVYEFQWRPNLCPPPPEPSGGPSTLVATGACAFRHQGAMKCSSATDDFYVEGTRPAARDATLLIYVNVERYKGPGKYDKAEMLVGVHDPAYNFRWFSDEVHITVPEDEKSVEIQPTRLEPLPPVEAPDIEVGGTLRCRPAAGGTSDAGGS